MHVKLDCALKTVENPTRERYATLGPGWDLRCPLMSADGLCGLQLEAGADALPEICRIYPRAFKMFGAEASMSASCERVVELLFALKEPLKFKRAIICAEACESIPVRGNVTGERYAEIRKGIMEILQNRNKPFPERILEMSMWLIERDEHIERDTAVYKNTLTGDKEAEDYDVFRLAAGLMAILGGRSESLSPYMEESFKNLTILVSAQAPNDELIRNAVYVYINAKRNFEARFPDWNERFEQLFVNHVFFIDFPWSDIRESFVDECVALGVTYIAVKFLSVAYMMGREKEEDLVDVTAACFRLIEHTAFDRSACSALMILENEHSVRFTDAVLRI